MVRISHTSLQPLKQMKTEFVSEKLNDYMTKQGTWRVSYSDKISNKPASLK